jgi:hypothetical protein
MHNIGSTQTESPNETGFEAEQFEFNEALEAGYETGYETGYEQTEYQETVLSPEAEAELAAEFMEISTEAELDRFLGSLIRKVGGALGGVIRSPLGQAIGGMLKGVARKALPLAGAALGNLVLPGVGGAIGGQLASAAGRMFGLEFEGLSAEDREYEVAKKFVQLAADVVRTATQAPPTTPPAQVAGQALAAAAQRYAPGLLQAAQDVAQGLAGAGPGLVPHHRRRSGRWIRRGHSIVVLGA